MIRKFISLVVVFLLLLSIISPLPSNAASSGSLTVNGSTSGQLSDSKTNETWSITTTSDGSLTINASASSGYYVTLTLLDTDGTNSISSDSSGYSATRTITKSNLAPGTYYVKIARDGVSGTGSYSISSTFTPCSYTNDSESNNDVNTPAVLSTGSTQYGHLGYYSNQTTDNSDWYSFTTTSDGAISIDVTGQTTLDLELALVAQDKTSTILSDTAGYTNIRTIKVNNLKPGTYYLRVYASSGGYYGGYSMTSSFTTQPLLNDSLTNDSKDTAQDQTLNSNFTGHLGYNNYIGSSDDADWYKFTTTSDGILKLDITGDSTLYLTAEIHELVTSGSIASHTSGYTNIRSVNRNDLKAGVYYLRVAKESGTYYGGYTVKATFIPNPFSNDSTSNDTYSSASPLTMNQASEGHIGYYAQSVTDTSDWYYFDISSSQRATVSVVADQTCYVTLGLYTSDGTTGVASDTSGYSTVRNVTQSTLAAGRYYIKIATDGSGQYGGYAINITNSSGPIVLVPQVQKIASPEIGTDSQLYYLSIFNIGITAQNIGQCYFTGDTSSELTFVSDTTSNSSISAGQVKTLSIKYTPKINAAKNITVFVPYGSSSVSAQLSIYARGSLASAATSTPIPTVAPTKVTTSTPTPEDETIDDGSDDGSDDEGSGESEIVLTQLQITPASSSLKVGGTVTLSAKAIYSDGSDEDVTEFVEWDSSKKSVVTVSEEGVVKAIAAGEATITGTLEDKTATVKITVKVTAPTKLITAKATVYMKSGTTATNKITAVYADGTKKDVTTLVKLTSSSSSVIIYRNTTIKAMSKGKATITVTYSGKKTTYKVVVK